MYPGGLSSLAMTARQEVAQSLRKSNLAGRHFTLTAGDELHLRFLILRGGNVTTEEKCDPPFTTCGGGAILAQDWGPLST